MNSDPKKAKPESFRRSPMDSAHALPKGAIGVRALGKVNLHLEVLQERPDGYHEIETILQTVNIFDTLHFVPRPSGLSCLADDPDVPVDDGNLVMQAAHRLLERVPGGEPPAGVRIDLYKGIPVAAGFAGGSSDAAATLVVLNRLWKLGLSPAELREIATEIGFDVPFFIPGGTALGRGRGEKLTFLPSIPETVFLLVFPKIPLLAGMVYGKLKMGLTRRRATLSIGPLQSILKRYPRAAGTFYNRLEDAVCPAYPEIASIVTQLLDAGASASMLSGSGSGVFATFDSLRSAEVARRELGRHDWRMPIVESRNEATEFFSQ